VTNDLGSRVIFLYSHLMVRNFVRWLLAACVIILGVWISWTILEDVRTTPDQIRTVDYARSRAIAFEFMRDDAKRFIDAAILIMAGLWSVAVVSKEDQLRRSDIPEMAMFCVATALLISFFYFTQQHGAVLERAYWDTTNGKQFPDVFNSPYLTMYFRAATMTFYSSLLASAATVFSLCVLRKRPQIKSRNALL
jgi:hypothetical protein